MFKMEGAGDTGDNWNCEKELENYKSRCSELEERAWKFRERLVASELKVAKKHREFALLEVKFKALEAETFAKEEQIGLLTRSNVELEKGSSHVEGSTNDRKGTCEREDQKEEKISQLMDAIKVLEYEKKNAEAEAENSMAKCRELRERLLHLQKENLKLRYVKQYMGIEENLNLHHRTTGAMDVGNVTNVAMPEDGSDSVNIMDEAQNKQKMVDCVYIGDNSGGTPLINTSKTCAYVEEETRSLQLQNQTKYRNRAVKKLDFGKQVTHINKMAPSTPGSAGATSAGIIDISDSDSDEELDYFHICSQKPMVCGSKQVQDHTLKGHQEVLSEKRLRSSCVDHQNDEEDVIGVKDNLVCMATPKRRRVSNVIMSDSDGDGDIDSNDHIEIELKNKHLDKMFGHVTSSMIPQTLPKRRLVKMAYCEEKDGPAGNSDGISRTNKNKCEGGIPTNEHKIDEVGSESESEGESLGGFIDDRSNSSNISDSSDGSDDSKDALDSNLEFRDILNRIQRSKNHKSEWEFEADMLAAFGKDPELCMKAVCALYRQQTSDEKCYKEALHQNHRGFSKFDAARGSVLAEFLTDGEPSGEVKKSVEELLQYDLTALELCKHLATHYSKQLFEIYKNKEDPLFLPSRH